MQNVMCWSIRITCLRTTIVLVLALCIAYATLCECHTISERFSIAILQVTIKLECRNRWSGKVKIPHGFQELLENSIQSNPIVSVKCKSNCRKSRVSHHRQCGNGAYGMCVSSVISFQRQVHLAFHFRPFFTEYPYFQLKIRWIQIYACTHWLTTHTRAHTHTNALKCRSEWESKPKIMISGKCVLTLDLF